MPALKVFVSSTCYDLHTLRSQARALIQSLGYEAIMSEYMEVLFDPKEHTHDSCVEEINNCDIAVLIIGSRFGGKVVPTALDKVDLEKLSDRSKSASILDSKGNLSITQLEICKALELGKPVYTFVESSVHHDHKVYEENKKNKDLIASMIFPSIDKQDTAIFIFEFINFIRHGINNYSVFTFSQFEDIQTTLKKQWSQLFQKLLNESLYNVSKERDVDRISSQIEDLKAAFVGSIGEDQLRDTAKGSLKFRRMISIISSFPGIGNNVFYLDKPWISLLNEDLGVENYWTIERSNKSMRSIRYRIGTVVLLSSGEYLGLRSNPLLLELGLSEYWDSWKELSDESKAAILEAIRENVSEFRECFPLDPDEAIELIDGSISKPEPEPPPDDDIPF